MMAMLPERKPEPAPLRTCMGINFWIDPNLPPGTIELRDKAGKVLGKIVNVATAHVGTL
jgi:hypothetical protein